MLLVDHMDRVDFFLLLEEEVSLINDNALERREVELRFASLQVMQNLSDRRHNDVAPLALPRCGEVRHHDVSVLRQFSVDICNLLRKLPHMGEHKHLGLQDFPVDPQSGADRECASLA